MSIIYTSHARDNHKLRVHAEIFLKASDHILYTLHVVEHTTWFT